MKGMKKRTKRCMGKRILVFVMVFCIMVNLAVPNTTWASASETTKEDAQLVASGKVRKNPETWELYDDGTLYIMHNGDESEDHWMTRRSGTDWQTDGEWVQYADEYGPFHVVIQQGFTNVGEGLFQSDFSVGSVVIPNSVTSVEANAFLGANNLEEVIWDGDRSGVSLELKEYSFCETGLKEIILPEGLTSFGKQVFAGIPAMEKIVIPGSIGELTGETAYWLFLQSTIETVVIEEGVTFIDLVDSHNPLFESYISNLYIPSSVTEIKTTNYTYESCIKNPEMIVWGDPGSAAEKFAREMLLYFNGEFLAELSVDVTCADETLDEDGYTINWYYEGSDVLVGIGDTITVDDPNKEMEYEVVMTSNDNIYNFYDSERYVTKLREKQTKYKCSIMNRAYIGMYGTVPPNPKFEHRTGKMEITQYWGDNASKTFTSTFDSFRDYPGYLAQSDLRDFPTYVRIDVEGFMPYSTYVGPENFDERFSWDFGNINLVPDLSLKGSVLLNIVQREPVKDGDTIREKSYLDFDQLTITAENNTTGDPVRILDTTYPYMMFDTDTASTGDEITVTVTDSNNESVSGKVTLDENSSGSLSLVFLKNGKITVSSFVGVSQTTAMLFDGKGGLISSQNARDSYTSDYLEDGNYSLAFIERNSLLGSVNSVSELGEDLMGLTEGTDYVLVEDITVEKGVVTDLGTITVPDFDELKYSCVDFSQTNMSPMYKMVSVGQMIDMRAQFAMTDGHTDSDKTMQIHLPENVYIVEGSLSVDGKVTSYKTTSSNSVLVDVGKESGTVRFRAGATLPGHYEVTSYLVFTEDGASKTQPVGTSIFEAESLSIKVPKKTGRKSVAVSGRAVPNSEIEVYDNDQCVGTASSNALGDWSLTYPLNNTAKFRYHDLYAVIKSDTWTNGIKTETATIEYCDAYNDVSSVSIVDTDVVFDYLNPYQTNTYIVDSSDFKEYTYIIRFDHDAASCRNVKINVFNEDRSVVSADAKYDGKNDYWVASVKSLPINVGVDFDYDVKIDKDDLEYTDIENIDKYISETSEELSALFTLGDITEIDDGTVEIQYGFAEEESLGAIYISTIDIGEFDLSNMEADNFVEIDGAYYQYAIDIDSIVMTSVYPEDQEAYSFTVPFEFIELEDSEIDAYAGTVPSGSVELGDSGIAPLYADGLISYKRATFDTIEKSLPGAGELIALIDLHDMYKLTNAKKQECDDRFPRIRSFLSYKCKYTGEYRLTDADRKKWRKKIDDLENKVFKSASEIESSLELYEKRIHNSLSFSLLTLGVTRMFEMVGVLGKELLTVSASFKRVTDAGKAWKVLGEYAGTMTMGIGSVVDEPSGFKLPTEDNGLFDMLDVVGSTYYNGIIKIFDDLEVEQTDIITNIVKDYQSCKDEPEEPEEPIQPEKSPCKDAAPIKDPSGFVCEAVASNRLEGVKATAYYDPDGTDGVVWDASEYSQENPLYTDEDGRYAWYVPNGNWQVKFEKSGYETTYSEWVPVPPIQTEVNVAMVSTAIPEVKSVTVYEDNVRIEFTQYMQPETVNSGAITLTVNGKKVTGKVAPLNKEEAFADPDIEYASIYKFTTDTRITASDSIKLSVTNAVSYNGKKITAYQNDSLKMKVAPEKIVVAPAKTVVYGKKDSIDVQILPENAVDFWLAVTSKSPDIAKPVSARYHIETEGEIISIPIENFLPGVTTLKFELEGTDLTAETVLTVAFEENSLPTCKKVTADLASGSYASGTKVTLSTETAGAQIYYTLDKTCPCLLDNPARTLYTGPITLTEEMYIIAYAVKTGYEDSATAGFHYTIEGDSKKPHSLVLVKEKNSTCTVRGNNAYYKCEDCGKVFKDAGGKTETTEDAEKLPLLEHKGGTATCVKKAVCEVCGAEYGTVGSQNHGVTEVRNAVAATGEAEGYTGDVYCTDCGKLIEKGTVVEKLGVGGNPDTPGNPDISKDTDTTPSDEHSGITVKKTKILKIKSIKNKKLKITWKKVSKASGYVIYRSEKKNGKYKKIEKIPGNKKVTYTDKKLKAKKKYYYKIVVYQKIDGKVYYSAYSKVASAKVK